MKHAISLLIVSTVLLAARSAAGAEEKPAPKPEAKKPVIEVVQMTLHPARPPRPALKYRLLPPPLEWTPGDAATLYMRALLMLEQQRRRMEADEAKKEWWDRRDELAIAPLDEVRREEVRKLVGAFTHALREAELASRCMECDWGLPIHEDENPYAILLPGLQPARELARIMATKARLHIADGDPREALETLQTGFALARHVAEGSTIVHAMVGRAIADLMSKQLETVIQSDVPNLYWSITALPHPLISLDKGLGFEELAPYLAFSKLHEAFQDPRGAQRTPEEWQHLWNNAVAMYVDVVQMGSNERLPKDLTPEGILKEAYPRARAGLIARGRSEGEVKAMVPALAVLVYEFESYEEHRDDVFKWFHVPYPQARKGLAEARRRIVDAGKGQKVPTLAGTLLPSLGDVTFSVASLERRLAALRCIEAVRLYAAAHDGKLPGSLNEVTEVPIPINPVTGEPFPYRLEGGVAVLEELSIDDVPPQRSYRLTIAK